MKNTSIRLAFVAIFACFAALSPQRAVAATSIADSPSGTVDTLSPLDSTTLAPALIAPASSAVSGSSVSVSFSLPEAALPGSVKLSFGGTVLTLAASQETSGAHSFTFNPANPTASPEVASGAAVVDGSYTVTLSYQDALGNPAASAVATDVVVDRVAPMIATPGDLNEVATGPTGAVVTFTVSVSDAIDADPTVVVSPASGSLFAIGVTTVTVTATDAAGNETTLTFTVTVTPGAPVTTVLASKNGAVPNAGTDARIQTGAVWTAFGVPSVNGAGQTAFFATWKAPAVTGTAPLPAQSGTGIFVNDALVVKKGEAVLGIPNAVFAGFKDPLLGPDGSVAWIASLANAPGTTGAVLSTDNAAILLDADGAGPMPPVVVARKGGIATGAAAAATIPPGVEALPEWGAFTSVALGSEGLAFTATMTSKTPGLTGAPGPGGVTSATDAGLWMYERDSGTLRLALREGNAALGSTVKMINALVARPGSAGQGRGVESDSTLDYAVFRVTLADNRQVAGYVDHYAVSAFPYVAGDAAPDYGAGALWQSFGVPTMAGGSTAMAFLGTVKALTGTATSTNNVAIFAEDDATYTAGAVVRKGDATGVSGGVFSLLKDPVNALGRSVAFIGVMKANTTAGISSVNDYGIWHRSDSSALRLIAREGAQPPEAPAGAQWKAFTSLALADGNRPLFVASMHSKIGTASPGPGGITTVDDVGLWAVDSAGALRLLIREGDTIGTSTVKTMTVLSTVSGSPAQTRSFNNGGHVILRVTDATGAQHLVQIAVP